MRARTTTHRILPAFKLIGPYSARPWLPCRVPQAAEAAVGFLKSRMFDGVVAMDLEWKPDTTRGESNPIALLQLSAAGVASNGSGRQVLAQRVTFLVASYRLRVAQAGRRTSSD